MSLIDRDIVINYDILPCILLVDVEKIYTIGVYLLALENVVEETRTALKGIQNAYEGIRGITVNCSSYLQ